MGCFSRTKWYDKIANEVSRLQRDHHHAKTAGRASLEGNARGWQGSFSMCGGVTSAWFFVSTFLYYLHFYEAPVFFNLKI